MIEQCDINYSVVAVTPNYSKAAIATFGQVSTDREVELYPGRKS